MSSNRRASRQALAASDDDWLSDLPSSYLGCRDMGHSWRPFSVRFDRRANQYVRTLRCSRCKTERLQALSVRGEIESSSYDYPDGYSRPKGAGYYDAAARAAVRLMDVAQQLEQAQDKAS